MPIFKCSKCGCIENTACSFYWSRGKNPPLCSECDPQMGKWHGIFPKESAKGYLLGNDGFLYSKDEDLSWRIKHQGFKIVGKVR